MTRYLPFDAWRTTPAQMRLHRLSGERGTGPHLHERPLLRTLAYPTAVSVTDAEIAILREMSCRESRKLEAVVSERREARQIR